MIKIVEVNSSSLRKRFIDFPHDLYKGDPNYVAELFLAQSDLLNISKNPFYRNAEIQLFLAFDGDRIVGRIAAIYNKRHNEYNGVNDGFFGFFDSIESKEVAEALFETATKWLKEKGLTRILGPANPSTNDSCGILVDGFDRPPVAMMTYNSRYYDGLLTANGFSKWTDLLAHELIVKEIDYKVVDKIDLLKERLAKSGISIRSVDMKRFQEEVDGIREVYNHAWEKNLGFVPMTEDEFNHLAKDLKQILRPEMCLVAEKEGKTIGWLLGVPDINQILIKIKRGRLFPTGIFKLLTQMKKIRGVRVITLGVLEPYRKLGIEVCLYGQIIRNTDSWVERCECSWLLEENQAIISAVEKLNAHYYKRYRMYQKEI